MKLISRLLLALALIAFASCKDDSDMIPVDDKYEVYIGDFSISPTDDYMVYGMDELKMLSLNNSLIEYNEKNLIFNKLAEAGGKNAVWEKQTRLGKSLQYHFDEGEGMIGAGDPSAKYRIRSEAWTHIILQEQSTKPKTDPDGFMESVKQWTAYIRENCPNPDAKIVLMLNWPLSDSRTYDADMENLLATYKKVAKETGASIIPAGKAFHIVKEIDGDDMKNSLYTDDRHPSVKASYLSACVFYYSLFNESPEGLGYYPAEITSADATLMQTRAAQAFHTHYNVMDYAGVARFNYDLKSRKGDVLTTDDYEILWNVDGGGTIDDNGVFTSDGTLGEFTVTATTAENKEARAKITVKNRAVRSVEYVGIEMNGRYTQDFNSIGTADVATLPAGWKIEKMTGDGLQRTVGTFNAASNTTDYAGGANLASNASNGLYNFGNSTDPADRAVGGITTSVEGGTRSVNVYLHLNNTGNTNIPALNIAYDIEKYRKGNNSAGFTAQMYCSMDGMTWSPAGDDFKVSFNPDNATEGYEAVPGDTRSVSAVLAEVLAPGESIYLAWNISVTSGSTCSGAQALALDNVVITAHNLSSADYIPMGSSKYTQDFDAIGSAAEATLPLGWRIEKRLDAPRVIGFFSLAGNQTEQAGGADLSSTAKNGIYNFGAGDADTATDRALGGISTGVDDGTRGVNVLSKYRNTAGAVSSVSISYDVEKYRDGNNQEGFRIQLYYSRNGRDWIEAGGNFRTYFAPDASTAGMATVPSEVRAVSATLPVQLAQNEDLYIAWNYSVNAGTACASAMALGVDNVEVSFNR